MHLCKLTYIISKNVYICIFVVWLKFLFSYTENIWGSIFPLKEKVLVVLNLNTLVNTFFRSHTDICMTKFESFSYLRGLLESVWY